MELLTGTQLQQQQDALPPDMEVLFGVWTGAACNGWLSPNVYVLRHQLSFPMEIWAYHALRTLGAELLSEESLTIAGRPAMKIVRVGGIGRVSMGRAMQVYMVDGETAWIIACHCSPGCWDRYEPIFETMIGTFHLFD